MVVRPTRVLTYEDYARFPDDGRRFEVIEGEAFMVPSPEVAHQELLQRLFRYIDRHVESNGGGRVFVAPLDVLLSDVNVVQPDVIFVSDERSEIVGVKNLRGVPTWLIEIVSDPVRDQKVKRDLYMSFGVDEYWAVVPKPAMIEVHVPGLAANVVEPPARIRPACLPGLEIDLSELFAD
jgi:Uma2 family endonuclease